MKKTAQNWEIMWALAKTDFRLRYHGSFLGFFWVILKPLLQFLVLNFVFSHVFTSGVSYSLGLFTGIVLWNYFAEGTLTGITSLLHKSHIITKIAIPHHVIVGASIMNIFLHFLLNIGILLLFFVGYQVFPSLPMLGVLGFYMVMISVLILNISLLLAPLYVRFRDIHQIWDVILLVGFYTAPIIYPITTIPENIRPLLYLNPMTFPIEHVKNALVQGQFIRVDHHLWFIVGIVLMSCIAVFIFTHTSQKSAEYV